MAGFDDIVNAIAIGEVLADAEIQAEGRGRKFRNRENPFDLSEKQFMRLFRLRKNLVNDLIDILEEYLIPQTRRSAIDVQTKVLIASRFFATGSYQMDIGCNIHLAVSQSTISRCINEVAIALNQPAILNTWITFPNNLEELSRIRTQFYAEYGFLGVIVCIDCTHVAIYPPKTNDPQYPEFVYINRKNYHSINVQLVCDYRLKIININALYPGSTNDSFIWNNSTLKEVLQELHMQGQTNYYLFGDQGYALRRYLLTPIQDEPEPHTPEANYNKCHKTTRSIIKRCNGVLKMRFRCLLKHRVLHYSPEKASKIIMACAVLHNMCIVNNVPDPEPEENDDDLDFGIYDGNPHVENDPKARRVNQELAEGRRIRQSVIRNHFT